MLATIGSAAVSGVGVGVFIAVALAALAVFSGIFNFIADSVS